MKLIYTGGGFNGSLPGIPARDLTSAEVTQYGGADQLVATGLYAYPDDMVGSMEPNDKPGLSEDAVND